MPKIPTVPLPEFSEYRNLTSELIAISRLVAPGGLLPTTVDPIGVSAPLLPILKPEMLAEALCFAGQSALRRTISAGTLRFIACSLRFVPNAFLLSTRRDTVSEFSHAYDL